MNDNKPEVSGKQVPCHNRGIQGSEVSVCFCKEPQPEPRATTQGSVCGSTGTRGLGQGSLRASSCRCLPKLDTAPRLPTTPPPSIGEG